MWPRPRAATATSPPDPNPPKAAACFSSAALTRHSSRGGSGVQQLRSGSCRCSSCPPGRQLGSLRRHHHRAGGGRRLAGRALPPSPQGRTPAAALGSVGTVLDALLGVVHGHRRGDSALPPVRPGPHHRPHPRLRPAHGAAGQCLCGGGPGARPAARPGLQPGRGRRDPGCGRRLPARSLPHPGGGRPAVQRHRHDAARTIAAFTDRLRQHVDLDTQIPRCSKSSPDDAAQPGVAVATAKTTTLRTDPRRHGRATSLRDATPANSCGPPASRTCGQPSGASL
jgi:hypothetical protein